MRAMLRRQKNLGGYMYDHGLILPVLTLVAWSLIVWAWMVTSRVSVMRREKIHPQKAQRTATFATPGKEMWIVPSPRPARRCGSSTTTTT
jgi:hypothetical protein